MTCVVVYLLQSSSHSLARQAPLLHDFHKVLNSLRRVLQVVNACVFTTQPSLDCCVDAVVFVVDVVEFDDSYSDLKLLLV